MIYQRTLDIANLIEKKSHFLIGPRSTGKSTLLRTVFPKTHSINLLKQDVLRQYLVRPSSLREQLLASSIKPGELVIIDEIQKAPALLDEIHLLIEEHNIRFLLTGSSARKLKRGAANLLAGRAWMAEFFPLTSSEISDFHLMKYLSFGGLPQVYTSNDPQQELKNYVNLYIKEEIQEEGQVRKLDQFLVFFESLALMNGAQINYQGWSSDTAIPRKTLETYVELMKDTLMAFELPAFRKTQTRKAMTRSKFYFFDVGVANQISGISQIQPNTSHFGQAFEHFIIQELRALNAYYQKNWNFSYWRTHSGHEVDLCLGQQWALEIKATDHVSDRHLKHLKYLREEKLFENYAVICQETKKREVDGITIWPWQQFLDHVVQNS